MFRTASVAAGVGLLLLSSNALAQPASAQSARPAAEDESAAEPSNRGDENAGKDVGLVLLVAGSVGLAVGGVLMVVGAELDDDPVTAVQTGAPTSAQSAPDTSAHALTITGAIVFVAGAAVGTVGGLMRWDWSDDAEYVGISPYVTVGGGGFVGTF